MLKLGFKISQATVAKYMVRRPSRPSPTWRSFLHNQVAGIAAIDMFVVASASFTLLFVMVILLHERRRNDHQAFRPARPPPRQQDPEQSISKTETGATSSAALQHGDLMAQRDHSGTSSLRLRGSPRPTEISSVAGLATRAAYRSGLGPYKALDLCADGNAIRRR